MAEEKKEEKKGSQDDLWATVRGIQEKVDKTVKALEKIFGVDIDRDGKIGRANIALLGFVAVLCLGVMAFAFTPSSTQVSIQTLDETNTNAIFRVDMDGNLTVDGTYTGAGGIGEDDLVVPETDGLGVKRTARMALTTANLTIGSNSLSSITIPDNAIVDFAYIDVTTLADSTSSVPSYAIGLEAEEDIQLATTGSIAVAVTATIPVGTAGTAVKTTAARIPWITVGAGDFSSGVATIHFEYQVGD